AQAALAVVDVELEDRLEQVVVVIDLDQDGVVIVGCDVDEIVGTIGTEKRLHQLRARGSDESLVAARIEFARVVPADIRTIVHVEVAYARRLYEQVGVVARLLEHLERRAVRVDAEYALEGRFGVFLAANVAGEPAQQPLRIRPAAPAEIELAGFGGRDALELAARLG